MLVPLLIIFILCLLGIRFAGTDDKYFRDYLSKNSTLSIKGVFTLLIFISHFSQYITYSGALDNAYAFFQSKMGQMVVAMFLFYSGYGIMESIDKKGADYIKRMPVHRVLKVLLHFDIAVLLFLGIQSLLGITFETKTILFSFIGWDSLGNSNWYIFDILCAYIITWLSFTVVKNKPAALVCTTILSTCFIIVMVKSKQSQWYDTFLCYVVGMWFSYFRVKLEEMMFSIKHGWLISFLFFVIAFLIIKVKWASGFRIIGSSLFAMGLLIFTMKFRVDNRVLRWLGDHLFEIYMLQRIPMIVLSHFQFDKINEYLYLVVCFIITIGISIVFKKFISIFDKFAFDGKLSFRHS